MHCAVRAPLTVRCAVDWSDFARRRDGRTHNKARQSARRAESYGQSFQISSASRSRSNGRRRPFSRRQRPQIGRGATLAARVALRKTTRRAKHPPFDTRPRSFCGWSATSGLPGATFSRYLLPHWRPAARRCIVRASRRVPVGPANARRHRNCAADHAIPDQTRPTRPPCPT